MINGEKAAGRSIRWGMIGGGRGSNIGYIHRSSAMRDGNFKLVAGAFDIDPERGRAFGKELGVDEGRCYRDYATMLEAERQREGGAEAISIATPNGTHYAISKACLEAGFHVVCEKPLCFTVEEARELERLSEEKGLVLGVAYGYSGHQLLRQARRMIEEGELGEIRLINTAFSHGFYTNPVENHVPAANWRLNPEKAGSSFVLGDVGTHALHLAETLVPGFRVKELLCEKHSFVEGRLLEDDAHVLMRCEGGIFATLWACAVNTGSQPELKIRIIGSKASLEWCQLRPDVLRYEVDSRPPQTIERGTGYLFDIAREEDRIGSGHAEGLFESWSNIYRRFAMAIDAANRKDSNFLEDFWYPDVHAGAEGVRFVEKCIESAGKGAVWVAY